MRLLRLVLVCLTLATVAVVSGSLLGGKYSRWRMDAEAAAHNARLDEYLSKNVKGIAHDQAFPEVPLWTSEGSIAYHVPDLLPQGGLIIYIAADCGSCIKTLDNLAVAQTRLNSQMQPTIVVVGGDASKTAIELTNRGVNIPAFGDTPQALANQYGVVAFPAYFVLDADHRIRAFGTLRDNPQHLVDLLHL